MSKEEIEKQLKLSKRQSKDERYDYLCSEFNAINYCINLEKYTNKLQQENQSLKKQLEEYENEPLTNKISRIDCVVSNIYSRNKTQKKEFIEYLEKTIEELECEDVDDEEMKGYLIQRIDTFKEILQKYKEIIGVSNEY